MSPELSAYIEQYGSIALFSLVFLQEIGVPNPIANELVLLFAGYLTSLGKLDFMTVWITAMAADALGTSLLYVLFYSCGHLVLQKWPRLLATRKLTYLTRQLSRRRQLWSIYLGRLIPFLRGYISVAAGLWHIPPHIFLPAVLLSALTWSGGYIVAGRLLGQRYIEAGFTLEPWWVILAGIACLGIFVLLGRCMQNWRTRKSPHLP